MKTEMVVVKDNDGHRFSIPAAKVPEFIDKMNVILTCTEGTDEWYDACDDLWSNFVDYSI